ncbi:hypothetical protein JOM56_000019 [Amanita muscaria]
MYNNGWSNYSPFPLSSPAESYPSPAPTPQVDESGIPIPPGAPNRRHIPLPPNSFSGIRTHPLLGYDPTCPCIEYDVRCSPTYASAPNARLEWAYESAMNPQTREMTITCMVLPRPFVVRPTFEGYDFVTILDVLVATHRAFCDVAHVSRVHNSRLPWSPSRSSGSMERFKWAGLSEQRAPGDWLLHIE